MTHAKHTSVAASLCNPRMGFFVIVRSVLLSLTLFVGLNFASAATEARKAFDIPAGAAPATLKEFSAQAAGRLLYNAKAVEGVTTQAVKGEFTAQEALERMLTGTPLVAVPDAKNGALSVVREDPEKAKNANRAIAESSGRPSSPSEKTETKDGTIVLDTFEVFGKKSLNMDIRRTPDDVQPYVVLNREKIQQSGATTLEELFRTRLTMNTTYQTNSQNSGNVGTGSVSSINLRGLGANQTLILVDGRRQANLNILNVNQPDINGIPLDAVERVEILPATASGIYGGGATGGVINIITRRNYQGAEVSVTYGNTFRNDLAESRVDASAGMSLNGGHTRVFIAGSYSKSDALTVAERDFTSRALALQATNNPSAFSFPPSSRLPNIMSADGSNLALKNGTLLNSTTTYVPSGYAGANADGGMALVANAGHFNYELPEDIRRQSLISAPTVRSFSVTIQQELGKLAEVYGDAAWSSNESNNPNLSGFTSAVNILPSSAPNNPFVNDIFITYPVIWPAVNLETDSTTLRLAGGAILSLPHSWKALADYSWSRSRVTAIGNAGALGDPDGPGPGISIASALSNGSFNVLRDVNVFPLDYTPFLLPQPTQTFGPQDAVLSDLSLRLAGPLWQLSGGPIALSASGERRSEKAKGYYQDNTGIGFTSYAPPREATVSSYYVETTAPVVSEKNGLPWLQELELQASGRYDDYETKAPSPTSASLASRSSALPTFTYFSNRVKQAKFTAGLRYSPFKSLVLRASYGTGFLPPSIYQIAPSNPLLNSRTSLVDPKRGGVSRTYSPINIYRGGNPNLLPEQSKSFSTGAIFTPRLVPNLRVSIDYTEIEKTNEIASPNNATVLLFEDFIPGLVTRAPLSPADSALGYTGGVVTSVDFSLHNVAKTKLRAVDIAAEYEKDFEGAGKVSFYTFATYQRTLNRQIVVGQPAIEYAGYNGGVLEWRANGGVTWERAQWQVGWNVQFYDSYRVYNPGATPAVILLATLNQGSAKIPSQVYHDLNIRYRIKGRPTAFWGSLRGCEIILGIQNLFDREPPVIATTSSASGGYSYYGDARLSRYRVTIRKRF